jgi:hypothetical protein
MERKPLPRAAHDSRPLLDAPDRSAATNPVTPSNVRPIDAARIRRIFGQPDLNEVASAYRPPFGERLVAFARRNQERFAVASLILATLLGCYMAWEFAR